MAVFVPPPPPPAICYTEKAVKDAACSVACRKNREHYQSGSYDLETDSCVCSDRIDFTRATEKAVTLPRRAKESY